MRMRNEEVACKRKAEEAIGKYVIDDGTIIIMLTIK